MSDADGRGSGRSRPNRRREALPQRADEALARARDHARAALAEAVLAARCLLDAASLAATGVPAEGHEALRRSALWLDRAAAAASDGTSGEAAHWLAAVAEALDAEIARWETRSRIDPEARAVLRAFLSVRELLWEFGLRRDPKAPEPAARAPRPRTAAPTRAPEVRRDRPARLERVPVDPEATAERESRSG
jgi:hypothetical protein